MKYKFEIVIVIFATFLVHISFASISCQKNASNLVERLYVRSFQQDILETQKVAKD